MQDKMKKYIKEYAMAYSLKDVENKYFNSSKFQYYSQTITTYFIFILEAV